MSSSSNPSATVTHKLQDVDAAQRADLNNVSDLIAQARSLRAQISAPTVAATTYTPSSGTSTPALSRSSSRPQTPSLPPIPSLPVPMISLSRAPSGAYPSAASDTPAVPSRVHTSSAPPMPGLLHPTPAASSRPSTPSFNPLSANSATRPVLSRPSAGLPQLPQGASVALSDTSRASSRAPSRPASAASLPMHADVSHFTLQPVLVGGGFTPSPAPTPTSTRSVPPMPVPRAVHSFAASTRAPLPHSLSAAAPSSSAPSPSPSPTGHAANFSSRSLARGLPVLTAAAHAQSTALPPRSRSPSSSSSGYQSEPEDHYRDAFDARPDDGLSDDDAVTQITYATSAGSTPQVFALTPRGAPPTRPAPPPSQPAAAHIVTRPTSVDATAPSRSGLTGKRLDSAAPTVAVAVAASAGVGMGAGAGAGAGASVYSLAAAQLGVPGASPSRPASGPAQLSSATAAASHNGPADSTARAGAVTVLVGAAGTAGAESARSGLLSTPSRPKQDKLRPHSADDTPSRPPAHAHAGRGTSRERSAVGTPGAGAHRLQQVVPMPLDWGEAPDTPTATASAAASTAQPPPTERRRPHSDRGQRAPAEEDAALLPLAARATIGEAGVATRPGNMQAMAHGSAVARARPRESGARGGATAASASAADAGEDAWGAFTSDTRSLAREAAAEAAAEGSDIWPTSLVASGAASQAPSLPALAALNPSLVNDVCPADWVHPAFSATLLTHAHDHAQPHAELTVSLALHVHARAGVFASPRYHLELYKLIAARPHCSAREWAAALALVTPYDDARPPTRDKWRQFPAHVRHSHGYLAPHTGRYVPLPPVTHDAVSTDLSAGPVDPARARSLAASGALDPAAPAAELRYQPGAPGLLSHCFLATRAGLTVCKRELEGAAEVWERVYVQAVPSHAADGLNAHAPLHAALRTHPQDKLVRLPSLRLPLSLLDGELDRPLLLRVTDTGASSLLQRDGYASLGMQRVTARGLLGWPLSVCPRAHALPTEAPALSTPARAPSRSQARGNHFSALLRDPADEPPRADADAEALWHSTQQHLHHPCPACQARPEGDTVCSHACLLELTTTRSGARRRTLYDRWDYLSVCACDGPCTCGNSGSGNAAGSGSGLPVATGAAAACTRMSALARQIAQGYQQGLTVPAAGGQVSLSDAPHTHAHAHTYWQRFGPRFLRRRAWSAVCVGQRVPLACKNAQAPLAGELLVCHAALLAPATAPQLSLSLPVLAARWQALCAAARANGAALSACVQLGASGVPHALREYQPSLAYIRGTSTLPRPDALVGGSARAVITARTRATPVFGLYALSREQGVLVNLFPSETPAKDKDKDRSHRYAAKRSASTRVPFGSPSASRAGVSGEAPGDLFGATMLNAAGASKGGRGRAVDESLALSVSSQLGYAVFAPDDDARVSLASLGGADTALEPVASAGPHKWDAGALVTQQADTHAVASLAPSSSSSGTASGSSTRPLPPATAAALAAPAKPTHANAPCSEPGALLRLAEREWRCVYLSGLPRGGGADTEPKWGEWLCAADTLCRSRVKRAVLACVWDAEDSSLLGYAVTSLFQLLKRDTRLEAQEVPLTLRSETDREAGTLYLHHVDVLVPHDCLVAPLHKN